MITPLPLARRPPDRTPKNAASACELRQLRKLDQPGEADPALGVHDVLAQMDILKVLGSAPIVGGCCSLGDGQRGCFSATDVPSVRWVVFLHAEPSWCMSNKGPECRNPMSTSL